MELPVAFCDEMKRILGDEYEDYLKSMEGTRKFGLRVNTAKISVEDFLKISPFELTPIPYVKNGFYYDGEKEQPAKHPYYFAGLYYLQDPSAMTPASRLPIEENDVVLDLCAAPGGKATELAAKLHGTGLLIANDISSKRAKALLKNIELFGVENSFIVTEYPKKLAEYFTGFFDKILIDAPCSGEGMFRKEPSMVKAWEQNGPEFYAALQEDILKQALPMLKPGGMLLYSTCTFSPLEDEGTVQKILSMNPDMEILPMEGYKGFASGKPELIGSTEESIRNCVRIFPHRVDGEGHFLALFRKKEPDVFFAKLTITRQGKTVTLPAKIDTGLTLTEPFSGTPAARLVRYSDYTTLLCLRQCIIGLDHLKIFFPNLAHAEQIHGAFVRHGNAFCIGRHIAGGFLPPGREVRGHNGA